MERFRRIILFFVIGLVAVACTSRERTLVILSTNDMHAKIQRIPQLAAAVAACRDTAEVVLVDAGDRWTGNAYVDMAPMSGLPIIALMNRLGYDVATLGNHEFDRGQVHLGKIIDTATFQTVCANVMSDTCTFPQLPPYTIIERNGIWIGVVGVVTNYEGHGYPAGNAESYRGLTFPDPQEAAIAVAAELRPRVDLLVLLSHMGDKRDRELLARTSDYDLLIGGHTHAVIDTLLHGTTMTQTGKDLRNVGVAAVRFKGRKIVSVATRIVSLSDYVDDPDFAGEVARYYADETLNRPVGHFAHTTDKKGLARWMASSIARDADAEIGLYHIGGVRLDSIPAGGVGTATIYNLEPFDSRVAVARMTPADMRRMIIAKYNDPINTKEAHRVDIVASTSYTIVTDASDNAVDVRFPTLRENRLYRVALSDYIFKNYKELHYAEGRVSDRRVTEVLFDALHATPMLQLDNAPLQHVIVGR